MGVCIGVMFHELGVEKCMIEVLANCQKLNAYDIVCFENDIDDGVKLMELDLGHHCELILSDS